MKIKYDLNYILLQCRSIGSNQKGEKS